MDDEADWKVMEGRHLVTDWEKIDGGDHALYIRQYNAVDGKYIQKIVPFRVGLYWYETWWFHVLGALLLLGLIIFIPLHFSS